MIYYRRYVKAFTGDTQAISMLEQGAYDRLLDHYYQTEAPIPADRAALIARAMSAAERKAVQAVLSTYFQRKGDCWHNKRADHEIEMAQKARANGAKGGGTPPPEDPPDRGADYPPDSGPDRQAGATPDDTPDAPPDRDILSAFKPTSTLQPSNRPTFQPSNLPTKPVAAPASQAPQRARKAPNPASLEAWDAYRNAYLERYGTEPVRNAKVNTHLARFVGRVGASEAPAIAAFYLTHSKASYVASKHDAKFLEMDAEGLRTEWATGQRVTSTQATHADRTQATGSVFQKLIDEAEARP